MTSHTTSTQSYVKLTNRAHPMQGPVTVRDVTLLLIDRRVDPSCRARTRLAPPIDQKILHRLVSIRMRTYDYGLRYLKLIMCQLSGSIPSARCLPTGRSQRSSSDG